MSLPPRKTAASVNLEPAVARAFSDLLDSLGSKASRVGYEKDWVAFRQYLAAENLDVLAVESVHVKRYVSRLLSEDKAKSTRGRAISVIRSTYRAFVEAGLVQVNPARETQNPKKGGTRLTPWIESEDDLAKILSWRGRETWLDRRDRVCVQLLAGLGWRRSEVAALKVSNFRGDVVTAVVKGGREESATVSRWLLEEIEAWKDFSGITSGALLPRNQKNRKSVSGDIVYNIVQRVGVDAGLPREIVTPHSLRRSLATHAERRGVPLGDIQRSLGHRSRSTTEHYLKGSQKVEHAPGEWMAELVDKKSNES